MPISLTLTHTYNGVFTCEAHEDRVMCDETLGNNVPCTVKISRGRSLPHHNLFFAKVKKLWENLPESEEERFPTAERLRKYLLVRAGHCERLFSPLEHVETMVPFFKLLAGFEDDLFFASKPDGVVALKAKTIEHAKVDQDEFLQIDKRVNDVIAREFGINTDELMTSARRDAA